MDINDLLGAIVRFIVLVVQVILAYINVIIEIFQSPSKKIIKGQYVLITGSGHGLGRELALRFADLGANLILVDINEANNLNVKQEILKSIRKQITVLTYTVDIREESNVADLAQKVSRDLNGASVDILINNAGIVQCLPFFELSSQLVERTFQVNVLSHIWTAKYFLPGMMRKERGHIVAISSIAGLIGSKYLSDYCASKFAVVGLMQSLEREIHDHGANREIHFTTVCPSCMSTGMFESFTSRFDWLLPVLTADVVADKIVDGILTDKLLVVIPSISHVFHKLSCISPIKVNHIVQDYLDYGVKPHLKQ